MIPTCEYEIRDLAENILKFLPECERSVLRKRFNEDTSVIEMGKFYGCSRAAVDQAIKKVLKTCRLIVRKLDKQVPIMVEPSFNEKSVFWFGEPTDSQKIMNDRVHTIGEEVVLRPSQIKWRKERDRRNLERKRERARWKREEKLARKREKEMEDYYREKERRELEEKMKTHEVKEFVDLDGYKFAAWIPKDRSNRKALEDALLEGLGIHKESINKVKMFEKLEKELTNGNC